MKKSQLPILHGLLILFSVFVAPWSARAINTGGDFNNRSAHRPANPETRIITRNLQWDYSPTIMFDVDGKYKMWWCGSMYTQQNPGGDNIMYSESTSLTGPWSSPISVFKGTRFTGGSATGWDSEHTCDPTVIRVSGTYYMWYGGIKAGTPALNRTGVASSTNGINWTRLNGGNPIAILEPINNTKSVPNFYGSGQPSAAYVDGWFYLSYSDDTEFSTNIARAYLVRSTDPTFPNNSSTQRLMVVNGQVGFHPHSSWNASTRYYQWQTSNADLMYHTGLNQFTLTVSGNVGEQNVIFFKKDFIPVSGLQQPNNAYGFTDVTGNWVEGPAIVRSPFGHSLFYPLNYLASQCVVPLDVIRSVGDMSQPLNSPLWDLAWSGMNLTFNQRCGDVLSTTPTDLDLDRVSDFLVYRPSTATFYRWNSTLAWTTRQIGTSNSFPIHGDFDGDGKEDIGVIDIAANTALNWHIIQSSNGQVRSLAWGGANTSDKPAIADYNGDGKDDVAVFRQTNGGWYVIYDNGATSTFGFGGTTGDLPAPADLDGDNKADLMFFRPQTGFWYVLYSIGNYSSYSSFQWGLPGDVPLVGDYFVDGIPDVIVWRPSDGNWHARSTANPAITETTQWGLSGDVPVLRDHNGDGKLDLTVYRPSNGTWYQNYRNGNTRAFQWGVSGDLPITNRY